MKKINEIVVHCKCGHSILFQKQTDRIICSWCGHWLYRTPRIEFKYKLKEKMKRKITEKEQTR